MASLSQTEKSFRCPYCREKISMVLDLSVDDTQTYIEDCEVCCRPIQLTFTVDNGELVFFDKSAI